MWAGSRQHIFDISLKALGGCYLMTVNLHRCFTPAHVEALGSAEEIHTQALRHAVRRIWSHLFSRKKGPGPWLVSYRFTGMLGFILVKQGERVV